MNVGSPIETILNGFEARSSFYSALQQNLSTIGALNSGVLRSILPNPIANLTVDSFRLSQMFKGIGTQISLAENRLKEEFADKQKIIKDLAVA